MPLPGQPAPFPGEEAATCGIVSREDENRQLKIGNTRHTFAAMSLAEIIEELPSLTLAERRELCRQTLALEPVADELAACDWLASEAMQELDHLEEESARRSMQG